jgi:hypothetical protein
LKIYFREQASNELPVELSIYFIKFGSLNSIFSINKGSVDKTE